jgi:hypothetical protein
MFVDEGKPTSIGNLSLSESPLNMGVLGEIVSE